MSDNNNESKGTIKDEVGKHCFNVFTYNKFI